MTNLKFRVWNNKTNLYEDDDFVILTNCGVYTDFRAFEDGINGEEYLVVEQYTGLKDRNGKDIYEGDVLVCEPMMKIEKDKTIRYVRHNGIYFVAQVAGDFGNMLFDCVSIGVTVIGNIHENGDLLK